LLYTYKIIKENGVTDIPWTIEVFQMSYIYQDTPRYDTWFKVVLVLPLVVIAFALFSDFKIGEMAKYVVIAVVAVVGLAFWLSMPRRFIIMEDHLKFFLWIGLSFSVPFDRIEVARELNKSAFNINLSTSNTSAVELVVKRGRNINFSPEDRDKFIRQLNKAVEKWREASQTQ
jgi:hypothetical protein